MNRLFKRGRLLILELRRPQKWFSEGKRGNRYIRFTRTYFLYHFVLYLSVNGQWSEWASWGACSATCGHAEQFRSRTCDFPPDKPTGHDCSGQANQTGDCTKQDCPGTCETT